MTEAVKGLRIEPFAGDRDDLVELFALADDSPAAVAAYRDSGTLLVAREGAAVLGLALVVTGPQGCFAELKVLAVAEDRQGTGLGTRLVEAAVETARRAGAALLEVSTASADIGNLRFYQRVGFRMARIVRDAFTRETGYPDGLLIDGIPLRDQVTFDRVL